MPTHQSAAPRQRVHHGVHEIRHDGFRIIARKDSNCVRLYSRAGNDRRLLLQLLLPGVNLVRVNLVAAATGPPPSTAPAAPPSAIFAFSPASIFRLVFFDDGSLPPYTNRVLDTLASECAKATFFFDRPDGESLSRCDAEDSCRQPSGRDHSVYFGPSLAYVYLTLSGWKHVPTI